jgi:hypothetical protein
LLRKSYFLENTATIVKMDLFLIIRLFNQIIFNMFHYRLLTIVSFLFFQSSLFSQIGNVVVFSENSDRFYVFVNGLQQNMEPKPNVKITNLPVSQYKIKVVFEDNTLAQLEKLVYTDAGQEYTYNIKRDKKGELKMIAFSMTEITNSNLPGQFVVVYGSAANNQVVQTNQNTQYNNNNVNNSNNNNNTVQQNSNFGTNTNQQNSNVNATVSGNVNVNANVNPSNNAANVNTNMGTDNAGFNMNISVSENGFNMNVNEFGNPQTGSNANANINMNNNNMNNNIGQVNTNANYQQTTTVTTTHTVNGQVVEHNSSTTQVNGQPSNNNVSINGNINAGQYNNSNQYNNSSNNQYNNQVTTQTNNSSNNQTSYSGCFTMNDSDFNNLKGSVKSKSFEDSKLTTAKQALKNNCMSTKQIMDIMQTFSFEGSKLDFAKAAYSKCSDQNNYYLVNDAFTFESSIDELNDFTNK